MMVECKYMLNITMGRIHVEKERFNGLMGYRVT